MSLRIAICCCNDIYGAGVKYLLERSKLDLDAIINCSQTEEIIDAKPDLLIADYGALSTISVDALVEQKVEILVLWSHCLLVLKTNISLILSQKGSSVFFLLKPTEQSLVRQ